MYVCKNKHYIYIYIRMCCNVTRNKRVATIFKKLTEHEEVDKSRKETAFNHNDDSAILQAVSKIERVQPVVYSDPAAVNSQKVP